MYSCSTIKTTFLLLILSFYGYSASAQSINTKRLDTLFNTLADNNKAMGSVAISNEGHIIYSKAIGYSYITDQEKVSATTDTRYRIASITKMYTATMILQLIEEGKLTFTTTLDKFFPHITNSKQITINKLLFHRSGLADVIYDTSWRMGAKTENELLDIITTNKTLFMPGVKADYSNTNFILLGYIIERICHQTYAEALQERICAKAKLENTYYGGATDLKKNESYSYKYYNGGWHPSKETDMSILAGAGAIISTPADMVKFIEALFASKLVNYSSLMKMRTIIDGYGMGLLRVPFYSQMGYGHEGDIDGFSSLLFFFPHDGLTVAYCSNGQVALRNDILVSILSICNNMSGNVLSYRPVTLTTAELDKYLGVYKDAKSPLKLTVTKEGSTLMAQGTDQQSLPYKAIGSDKFVSDNAGIQLDFDPLTHTMTLEQWGMTFKFTRQ